MGSESDDQLQIMTECCFFKFPLRCRGNFSTTLLLSADREEGSYYTGHAAHERLLQQIKADQELYDAIKAAELVDEMEQKVEAYRQRNQ